jgi:hypothetical protein
LKIKLHAAGTGSFRAAEMMGKHYGLFTDRIEAVVTERSSKEIQIKLEAKLQQFLLCEAI